MKRRILRQTRITSATLPVPSYARITNLANGRMVVVRINDRGPYGNDRVISLSRAAADRLNTSNNTKVRIDPIIVAQDGSMSGPGTVCTTIAKQTYALPALPDLSGNGASQPQPAPDNVRMVSNSTLKGDENTKPVSSGGFLGAPTPLHAGVLEGSEAVAPAVTTQTTPPVAAAPVVAAPVTRTAPVTAPITAPGSVQGHVATSAAPAAASGSYMVQVGAVSDQTRAQQYQQRLAQQFSVPGRVVQNGAVWRIQLGPFTNKSDASALQQRLRNEAQLQSFVTNAQ